MEDRSKFEKQRIDYLDKCRMTCKKKPDFWMTDEFKFLKSFHNRYEELYWINPISFLEREEIKDLLNKFIKSSGFDFTHPQKVINYESYRYSIGPLKTVYEYRKREKKFFTKKKNFTIYDLYKHFFSNVTVGTIKYKHTKKHWIDIDNDPNNPKKSIQILDTLVSYFGEPVYIERNEKKNSYHLLYEFNNYVSDNTINYFIRYMKNEHDTKNLLEWMKGGKTTRLPFSEPYRKYAGTYCKSKRYRVKKISDDRYNPHTALNVLNRWINSTPTSVPKILKKLEKPHGTPITSYRKNSMYSQDYFSYGAGTRHIKQPLIALHCIKYGKTFDEFRFMCERFNYGSKDMDKSKGYIYSMLKSIWDCANFKYVGSTYYSNEYRTKTEINGILDTINYCIPTKEKNKITRLLKKHINSTMKYKKSKNKRIQDCLTLYEHLISKRKYDLKTENRYRKKEFEKLNDGVQFSKEYKRKFGKAYSLQNVEECFRILIQAGLVREIVLDNGYSYSYKKERYCKHYIIYNYYNRIVYITSITYNKNKCILSINKLIRYYFSDYKLCGEVSDSEFRGQCREKVPL